VCPPGSTSNSRITQRAGEQSRDRVDHHQRRQLAAAQHCIAHRHRFIDARLDEPLVHAFVPAGHEHQFRAAADAPLSFVCIVPEGGDY
jgi:hypothetical protein